MLWPSFSAPGGAGPASSKAGTRALATATSPWRQSGVLARSLAQTYRRARRHHSHSRALRRRGAPVYHGFMRQGGAAGSMSNLSDASRRSEQGRALIERRTPHRGVESALGSRRVGLHVRGSRHELATELATTVPV